MGYIASAVRSRVAAAVVLSLALVSSACIKEENIVTWYLEPGGQVTWSILERNVRSDAKSRDERSLEEDQFISLARSRQHPAAAGLSRLGALGVKATILHDKPPFTVATEGQFSGLDWLGRRLLATYGMSGSSVVTRDGENWVWTLTIDHMPSQEMSDQDTAELTALLGDELHVALREGEFADSPGFELDDDKRTAKMNTDLFDERKDEDGPKVIKLVWHPDRP